MEKLTSEFKIKPIDNPDYKLRLEQEINLLTELNYIDYIVRIVQIYNKYIIKYQNMLRGSSGSSLVLYYLGINKIDPIKFSIPLSRFINKLRQTIPDIDIDIPLNLRDGLIDEIIKSEQDCIRMSNDYTNNDNKYIEDLIKEDSTFTHVHSSGVIIFDEEQWDIIKKFQVLPKQISLTKFNIGNYKLKKIDLLANTALEQLCQISKTNIFDYDFTDKKVFEFIWNDDGIGITYAETPQMQNIFKILKPSNIEELSKCLAIIRPLSCHNISKNITWDYLKNKIIYDDDFIIWVKNNLGYSEEQADEIRRVFKSNIDKEKMDEFINKIESSGLDYYTLYEFKKTLFNLSKYSFCKSHSLNYAHMIYCLYWNKYYNPKKFWFNTIKIIKGFYRDWVYIRKGLLNGLKFKGIENCSPFYHLIYTGYWIKKEFVSRCYLRKISQKDNDNLVINNIDEHIDEHIDEQKVNMKSDSILSNSGVKLYLEEKIKYDTEYEFRGIIAGIGNISNRNKKYQMVITIGYDNDKFINLHLNKKRDLSRFTQVIGKGYMIDGPLPYIVITKMTLM